jgi:hypothetical protein
MKATKPKRECKEERDIDTSEKERNCSRRLDLRLTQSPTKELGPATADFKAFPIIALNVENRENHEICSQFCR